MTHLRTPRLLLRPMMANDAEPLLGVFGDPAVMDAFGRGPFDVAEMRAWVARNLEHQARHGYGLFTIVLSERDEVIGDCGLEVMELDGVVEHELGYDLRRDRWGRGIATEAAMAVKAHALDALRLPRLVSLVRSGNRRSARVAEKLGMSLEREIRRGAVSYDLYATPARNDEPA